jgi:hypothetical protein
MPLKITPSKKPLPMAKRSLLRQSSQIPTEIAPLISSDSVQSPPEVASEKEQVDHSESVGSSWQTATSRRSARTLHRVQPVISSRTVVMYDDVMNNPPPASAVTSTTSVVEASTLASAESSVSTVDNNSSVGLPTSVVDSTSVLSNPSPDVNPTPVVNPTSVVESLAPAMTLVNPITGELTTLTAQQQQYITQATVTALSLTSDALAQRTLSQNLDSNRSQNVPIFSESVYVQPELSKTLRKKQKKAMNKLRLPNLSQSSESTVVSTSASLSSPVQSPVSIGTTHLVSDNTVAPSRYNPYQEKTIFLKGKIDRKLL